MRSAVVVELDPVIEHIHRMALVLEAVVMYAFMARALCAQQSLIRECSRFHRRRKNGAAGREKTNTSGVDGGVHTRIVRARHRNVPTWAHAREVEATRSFNCDSRV